VLQIGLVSVTDTLDFHKKNQEIAKKKIHANSDNKNKISSKNHKKISHERKTLSISREATLEASREAVEGATKPQTDQMMYHHSGIAPEQL
jgi:hypothetical protein